MTYVENKATQRIHNDNFWTCCEFVEDAAALLQANADRCKRELNGLLEDVKQLTSKLGVSPSLALNGSEAGATSLALSSSVPAAEYKTALVKAKEETLPEIFKQIQNKSAEFGMWLSAQVIPMKAEAGKLKPVIERVEDRIFSVELYAGLCESVEQIKDGEPAALTEPVHLFQRRLYMDEECLANYETGGMEFKNLRARALALSQGQPRTRAAIPENRCRVPGASSRQGARDRRLQRLHQDDERQAARQADLPLHPKRQAGLSTVDRDRLRREALSRRGPSGASSR
jgi:hypothetical protein